MRNVMVLSVLTVLTVLTAGVAQARPALQDVEKIENGLFAIAVADKIRRECDGISGRLFRARRVLRDLADHATGLGYSDAEIRTYVDSDVEKTRMRARRDAYLSDQGVVKSDPSTYCAVGRTEIQKSSDIGGLLRER